MRLPEKGENYLFVVKKAFPNKPENNFYVVLGGENQGIFKVDLDDKKNINKTYKFNDENNMEKEVSDKNLEELIKNTLQK